MLLAKDTVLTLNPLESDEEDSDKGQQYGAKVTWDSGNEENKMHIQFIPEDKYFYGLFVKYPYGLNYEGSIATAYPCFRFRLINTQFGEKN